MPTPHISAAPGDFAEAVLLPGDPRRARHIAEQFLDGARLVTEVRAMAGFTGTYQGMPVSVMGTGMGVPSAAIYITELIDVYGASRLVRVGSTGGISAEIALRDIVIAIGASTDSSFLEARYGGMSYSATADFELLRAAVAAAGAHGITPHVGNVHTSDSFYNPRPEQMMAAWQRMGILAVEMETAGLYAIAAEKRVRALSILTVSDHLALEEQTSSDERERTFDEMVEIALAALVTDAG